MVIIHSVNNYGGVADRLLSGMPANTSGREEHDYPALYKDNVPTGTKGICTDFFQSFSDAVGSVSSFTQISEEAAWLFVAILITKIRSIKGSRAGRSILNCVL